MIHILRKIDPVNPTQVDLQVLQIPLLRIGLQMGIAIQKFDDEVLSQPQNVFFLVLSLQHLAAESVDLHPLFVHDIVVLQEMLPDFEVPALYLLLGSFNLAGNQLGFDGNAFLHSEFLHKPGNIFGAKDSHEIVLERQIKAAGAGISLATGSTSELIVNAPSLMSLGANDVNPTQFDHLIVLLLPNR